MRKLKEKIFAILLICIMTTEVAFAAGNADIYPSDSGKSIYTVNGDESKVPELLSHSAIVVDMKTGYTLVEKNIKDKLYPASITKIAEITMMTKLKKTVRINWLRFPENQ